MLSRVADIEMLQNGGRGRERGGEGEFLGLKQGGRDVPYIPHGLIAHFERKR